MDIDPFLVPDTIDEFGDSGNKNDVLKKHGFTVEEIISKIEKKLNQ